ncbi:dienelactone hydrolase family protein [Microvirga sp. 2TAF3]|uniref:dienelactone hydrolase family protein n=1 Tax=Microvirga sp. 2TAF3 TaxID=3233014 RepID=UPI003F9D5238
MTVTETRQTFSSGGKAITVDIFEASQSSPRPAVIMLHGADGVRLNAQYKEGARGVAAAGYQVHLVHYLDRTGERRASLATLFQNFQPWTDTVADALAWVSNRADIDPARLGIIGISLGAALGLAISSMDRRIRALVNYFGPLPQGAIGRDSRLPPTLVLHGALDPIVPVANAYTIEALLRQQEVPHELKIYPGEGHGFRGKARQDAMRRVLAFLDQYLASEPNVTAPTPLSAGDWDR